MVAPSFQKFEQVKEPYRKNGKMYTDVRNPFTGTVRSVRHYTSQEYSKLYGPKTEKKAPGTGMDAAWEFYYTPEGNHGLKQAMGFSKGPILVIRDNKSKDEDWLRRSVARYSQGIGWYIASEDALPTSVPANFKFLLLSWDEYKLDETHGKRPSQLAGLLLEKFRQHEFVRF